MAVDSMTPDYCTPSDHESKQGIGRLAIAASLVRRLAPAALLACGTLACIPSPALSYTFGAGVTGGTPVPIFVGPNPTTCPGMQPGEDAPDGVARAFRYGGQVQFFTARNTRVVKRTLEEAIDDGSCERLTPPPGPSTIPNPADPANFNDYFGPSSPYVIPNTSTIYALAHEEYHGSDWVNFENALGEKPNANCAPTGQTPTGSQFAQNRCARRSTVWLASTDGGASYAASPAPAPQNLVSSLPYKYQAGWGPPAPGFNGPTNIVFNGRDGYYYTLFFVTGINNANPPKTAQQTGTCVMRTPELSAGAWRAWGKGEGSTQLAPAFNVRFVNPYTEPGYNESTEASKHACTPLPTLGNSFGPWGLVYSTFFHRYMIILTQLGTGDVYYALSTNDELTSWTEPRLLMKDPKDTEGCPTSRTVAYPTVIDPNDPSANFEDAGARPYLYFVHWHLDPKNNCALTNYRDTIRIPIQFQSPQCTGPVVSPDTGIPGVGTIGEVGLGQYLNSKALVPDGSVVCLTNSSYKAGQNGVLTLNRSNITVRNVPGSGVYIQGRIVLDGPRPLCGSEQCEGANHVGLYGLSINGEGVGGPTVTVTGYDDSLERDTITNVHQGGSCVKASYDPSIGAAPDRLTVESDRIYDCGGTAPANQISDDGVEISNGSGHLVANNWIYENSGSGVRVWSFESIGPAIQNVNVAHNVIADNCATSASSTACYGQTSFERAFNSTYRENTVAFPYAPPGNSTPPYNFYFSGLQGSYDALESNCWWKPEGTDHMWVKLTDGGGNRIPNNNPVNPPVDPQFPDHTNLVHAWRNYSIPSGNACYSMQPSGPVGGGAP